MSEARTATVADELRAGLPGLELVKQPTADGVPTLWVDRSRVAEALRFLKETVPGPYRMLYDLTAIDERARARREGQPASDFTVVYRLLSFDRNADVRLKVALEGEAPSLPSIVPVWPAADWYEREVWDMFGIRFEGHPNLHRILMPPTWTGHPLRKDHPARATDMPPFELPPGRQDSEQEALEFRPEDWGMARGGPDAEFMFLNLGPHHPGTHGVLRVVLQLDGEEVVGAVPDIGYHHRGAEKMGERQTWHTYLPYTDRVDYLGGLMNNMPYLLALEQLAGITVPDRAVVTRVMLSELFRVMSHLIWYGTFGQDVGALSPVFYTFNDRERGYDIVSAICGARMHPHWFRLGGLSQDLPEGWDEMILDYVRHMERRIDEFDGMVLHNGIFRSRTVGIGTVTQEQAIEWGLTGPMLRSAGLDWDLRKRRPYSGYDQFDFEIPVATEGDCHARAVVRSQEMRQSLRIMEQCVRAMPPGPYKADHPLVTPPRKGRTMHDIETLITHFLSVSWGPVMPAGEVELPVEATKGMNSYYLVSDGGTSSYRTRIRTPSFPHLQALPLMARGHTVADVLAIMGALDYVLADVDR